MGEEMIICGIEMPSFVRSYRIYRSRKAVYSDPETVPYIHQDRDFTHRAFPEEDPSAIYRGSENLRFCPGFHTAPPGFRLQAIP